MSDQQMNEAPLSQEGGAAPQSPATPLPGAVLAEQRQKKGWTIEQAASLIKLAPRQVHAIETDNYAALPGLAVARGFVRSYAKVLGLDANAVIAGMPQDSPVAQRDHIVPQHQLSTPFSEGPLPTMMLSSRGGSSPATTIIGALVLVAVVGAAAVHWSPLGDNVPQLAWLKPHAADANANSNSGGNGDAAVGGDVSNDIPVNARVDSVDASSSGDNASKLPESAPAAVAAAPAPAAVAAPAAPSAIVPLTPSASVPATAPSGSAAVSGATAATGTTSTTNATDSNLPSGLTIVNSHDLLRLTFREDSWVEIRRADKTTIISRLLKAGTTEAFDVADASLLVIGNAAGVDATLRGKPLELKAGSGNNVARLNLN